MGQGRRCVAAVLVALFACAAVAAELPNAPSSERPSSAADSSPPGVPEVRSLSAPPVDLAELRGLNAPPVFSVAEWQPEPFIAAAAVRPAPKKKVFDKKFALLAGLAAGLTVADFEMTQRCLRRRTCAEADPLMPTSHAGMYATNIPLNAALFWWSYRRKEDGKRLWWLAPLMVVGSHAVGVGTNIRFVGK